VVLRSFFVPTELVEVSGKIPIAGLYEMLQIISFVDLEIAKVLVFRPHRGDCGDIWLDTVANSLFRQGVPASAGAGAVARSCGEIPLLPLKFLKKTKAVPATCPEVDSRRLSFMSWDMQARARRPSHIVEGGRGNIFFRCTRSSHDPNIIIQI
jgi:hypothetical protein